MFSMSIQSNNPTINKLFSDDNVPISDALNKFESGSREIENHIQSVLQRINVAGQTVADVGAGTGVFIHPIMHAIGEQGKLYLAEPAKKFHPIMQNKISSLPECHQSRVVLVLSNEVDVMLPAGCIDTVICFDVYHHFEYVEAILASIKHALKPNGRLVVCDFYKDFNEWSRGHVRAEKEQCVQEIIDNGFRLVDDVTDLLKDNWLCVFTPVQ